MALVAIFVHIRLEVSNGTITGVFRVRCGKDQVVPHPGFLKRSSGYENLAVPCHTSPPDGIESFAWGWLVEPDEIPLWAFKSSSGLLVGH